MPALIIWGVTDIYPPVRPVRSRVSKLIDPRYRRLHLAVIVTALVVHTAMHYATFVPALRGLLAELPYFRLHVLHEAEFLLIVAYAGVVVGLRTGIAAVVVTGVTSIPFILSRYFFDD